MKTKLVPYEIIEKAVGGDMASLFAIKEHYKPFIGYLSNADTALRDILNSKLLEAILKFKLDYQPPSEYVRVSVSPNSGLQSLCLWAFQMLKS